MSLYYGLLFDRQPAVCHEDDLMIRIERALLAGASRISCVTRTSSPTRARRLVTVRLAEQLATRSPSPREPVAQNGTARALFALYDRATETKPAVYLCDGLTISVLRCHELISRHQARGIHIERAETPELAAQQITTYLNRAIALIEPSPSRRAD